MLRVLILKFAGQDILSVADLKHFCQELAVRHSPSCTLPCTRRTDLARKAQNSKHTVCSADHSEL